DHNGESDGVITSKEFGMIAGCDTEDAIEEGVAKIYNLITRGDTKEASTVGDAGEFALIGVTYEVHNCPFVCDNKYNELHKQYNEINEQNDHSDLDESHMYYGTKSSTSSDSKLVSNDLVTCDYSEKSSQVNPIDFALSDSSIKSSEPKPNDYTLCALTSSVSTSKNEAEIESNVGTPIQEPIIV
nr:hypothetical protein [Tanacetum cinerariifolium]